jgi:hypothetical protein
MGLEIIDARCQMSALTDKSKMQLAVLDVQWAGDAGVYCHRAGTADKSPVCAAQCDLSHFWVKALMRTSVKR